MQDHVAVVMPAFNEAEALPSFITEIRAAFDALSTSVKFIVVDDSSTDGTSASAQPFAEVVRAAHNRGHGPSALAAYGEGLASGARVVVHVDGDGQFRGDDIVRVALAVERDGADVVHGVRRGRTDPWFRRCLSVLVRLAVLVLCGRSVPDVNTPLRAYRPDTLQRLIRNVPERALVPHVHFSVAEARLGLRVRYVRVASIPRRGTAAQGTMWGTGRARVLVPPLRLVRFASRALLELWRVDIAGGHGVPARHGRPDAALRG